MKVNHPEAKELLFSPTSKVVVDFDDTLADTGRIHKESIIHTIKQLYNTELTIDAELRKKLKGRTTEEIFIVLFEHLHLEITPEPVQEAVQLRWELAGEQLTQLKLEEMLLDGVPEFTRALREQGKVAAIATNSARSYVETFLQHCTVDAVPLIETFTSIVGEEIDYLRADNAESKSKPNPYHVHAAAQLLDGDAANRVVYIGDNAVDIATIVNDPELIGIIIHATNTEQYSIDHGDEVALYLSSFLHLLQ